MPGASPRYSAEAVVFLVVVLGLAFGNLIYLFARLGFLRRHDAHRPVARDVLEGIYGRQAPRLAILIPSYREEERVLMQTILSVALMEYPQRRVVVLLDDPPSPSGPDPVELQAARALVRDLNETFATRARVLERERLSFVTRARTGCLDLQSEGIGAAHLYRTVADWLDQWGTDILAASTPASRHTDQPFVEKILRQPAAAHRARAERLVATACDAAAIAHEYDRLAELLKVEIESFERKRYANLSHQPNKAMNLNSYIGLIGSTYRDVKQADGVHLVECSAAAATIRVPPADYLLTIDADSFVVSDYALRLIHLMENDTRIAVGQTPYSAVPDAPTMLERAAGATTDIQYFIHQGFTQYDATYWVGANAMLRVAALQDVCTFVEERGHRIPVFIQDRTVIEDTGSTVDLIRRGWQLHNYPERLAYSATPPDFGSLIIQRRRWSNGGLIIFPDLVRHLWASGRFVRCLPEAAMRAYYLCSPAIGNIGLLILLLYRFDDSFADVWLPLAAAPYYLFYGRDLRHAGYRWSDLLRVYALNLLLLPVNLAGVLRSVQQLITGRKAAFGRTPKVERRTVVPPVYVAFHWLLLGYLVIAGAADVVQGLYSHAGFALLSISFLLYAITSFMGWRDGLADLREGLMPSSPVTSTPRPAYAGAIAAMPVLIDVVNSNVQLGARAREDRRQDRVKADAIIA